MARWYVYIVRCSDGTLYTGSTTNVKRRVHEHSSGRGARYTRSRRPVVLCYLESGSTRSWALKREFKIKRLARRSKLILCRSYAAKIHSIR